ncbi:MAG: hypothetical protein A2Y73_08505 [Chloroflexi bacterium RBG_13_56_8]|nr:MAG: hypothetical protein A2Y73_08505 [Chloroflexi bacterium RBG_13_56_8]
MDSNHRTSEEPGKLRRDLLVGISAFLLIVLVSFGALVIANPSGEGLAALGIGRGPSGKNPVELALIHSNDTWGYLSVCGG